MSQDSLISIERPEDAPAAKTYDQLLSEYCEQKVRKPKEGRLIEFLDIPVGKDAYNPSGPFDMNGSTHQWARVESRKEQDAVSVLFIEDGSGRFVPVPNIEPLPVEDPFTFSIQGEHFTGGVEIHKDEHGFVVGYRTLFYRGSSHNALVPFACGPEDMKDIRFAEFLPGMDRPDVFVFTRPHIPEGVRMLGRIAITTLKSIDELTPERLMPENTELIRGLFAPAEWGGVNDAYALSDTGLIGALAHISKLDTHWKRHYAAAVFVIDPIQKICSPLEIIAERGDFPMGPVKIMPEYLDQPMMYDDLADVVFPSRLTAANGDLLTALTLDLTCGLSDAAVGVLPIPNPFPRHVNAILGA